MERRLYRSRTERVISGVCGGIAEQMQVDATLVRLAAVVLALVTQGAAVIAYIVMAIVVPEAPFPSPEADTSFTPPAAGHMEKESAMAENTGSKVEQVVPAAPEVPSAPQVPAAPPAGYAPAPTPPVAHPHGHRGGVGLGVVLIVIGLALLANQFIPDFDVWRYWPVAVILLGVASVMRGLKR